jgi:hypothetical protein
LVFWLSSRVALLRVCEFAVAGKVPVAYRLVDVAPMVHRRRGCRGGAGSAAARAAALAIAACSSPCCLGSVAALHGGFCDVAPCQALVELCCAPDSGLGLAAEARGLSSCRITEPDRFDLARGLAKARGFIADHGCTDSWAALPCTAWCTWQYINEAKLGKEFASRLA